MGRELTKTFETIIKGDALTILSYLKKKPTGEIKLVFYSANGDSIITFSNKVDKFGEKPKKKGDFFEDTKNHDDLLPADVEKHFEVNPAVQTRPGRRVSPGEVTLLDAPADPAARPAAVPH